MVQNALIVVAAFLVLAGLAGIGAGAPSSFAGLGLGSTLLESGTVALVGGLILFGLVLVLNALRDLEDRLAHLDLHPAPAPAPSPARPRRALPAPSPSPADFEPNPVPGDAMEMPHADQRFDRSPPAFSGEEQIDPLGTRPRRPVVPSESRMEESLRERRARRERERENGRDTSARGRPEKPAEPAPRARRETIPEKPAEPAPRSRRDTSFSLPAGEEPRARENSGTSAPVDERRRARSERTETPPPAEQPKEEPHLVTERNPTGAEIVRSGIIGSMAYTLYSDGSIEAELPIGTVRFASLTDLQHHVMRTGEETDGEFVGTKQ